MDQKRRVVVTGLGLISPLGNSVKTSWYSAIEGKSGAAFITKFDTENFLTKFGATVKDFEALDCIDPKEARRTDLFIQYGTAAAIEANLAVASSDLLVITTGTFPPITTPAAQAPIK